MQTAAIGVHIYTDPQSVDVGVTHAPNNVNVPTCCPTKLAPKLTTGLSYENSETSNLLPLRDLRADWRTRAAGTVVRAPSGIARELDTAGGMVLTPRVWIAG